MDKENNNNNKSKKKPKRANVIIKTKSNFVLSDLELVSTVVCIVQRCTQVIVKQMMQQEIVWPTAATHKEISRGFKRMKGIEHVIGATDGCHIPISGRSKYPEMYVN